MHVQFEYRRTAQPVGKPLGLGDAVALIAEPIARALDATTGTRLVKCSKCAQRKAALNAVIPNISRPFNR